MKANQAFRGDQEAVSPVIGVIMMVAITVVLAASVYVWVSSQNANATGAPGAFAVTSAGNAANPGPGNFYKNFTMVAAMPGFTYGQMALTLDGAPLEAQLGGSCEPTTTEAWTVCNGGSVRGSASSLGAGDVLTLRLSVSPTGATLRFVDPASNGVLYTATIG